MILEHAMEVDFPAIINLVNAAYRGTGAVESWNIETGIIEGTRLTDSLLRQDLAAKPHAHFLVHRSSESGAIIGTVWLEPVDNGNWYLGLFTVDPSLQKQHLGRGLLSAAEDFAKARGAAPCAWVYSTCATRLSRGTCEEGTNSLVRRSRIPTGTTVLARRFAMTSNS